MIRKGLIIKIGSSSLMHEQTGRLDLLKIENAGKDSY